MYDDDVIDKMQERMDELVGLIETRKEAFAKNVKLWLQAKIMYDKRVVTKKFELDDLVLNVECYN